LNPLISATGSLAALPSQTDLAARVYHAPLELFKDT
jgi:hypothetical protein